MSFFNTIKINTEKQPRKLHVWQVSFIWLLASLYEWHHYALTLAGKDTAWEKNCVFEQEHVLKQKIKRTLNFACMSVLFSRCKWQQCLRPQAFKLLALLVNSYCFYWIYGSWGYLVPSWYHWYKFPSMKLWKSPVE